MMSSTVAGLRLGLADDGEIEAPRDAAELIAGAGETGAERERLGREAGAPGRLGEAIDGGLRAGFVVGLLRFDHFGRDIAGARNRNDRIVDEGDAGKMRVERSWRPKPHNRRPGRRLW